LLFLVARPEFKKLAFLQNHFCSLITRRRNRLLQLKSAFYFALYLEFLLLLLLLLELLLLGHCLTLRLLYSVFLLRTHALSELLWVND